ncbi:hypothetical protein FRACYDRAFT_253536 [Fragilariopsis cylindrus CCMP1102]|uniref:WD40 repeat-like protein n=1 Tax=Fragilariopsis cylindrus CCMP1102 TaxID=635003 RepID=A0A1E7ELK1_9STRA|nr:hypothetical protein FRACYDRAFT_253536 [Fragilariopsis cylindrus CCMP1102]|eukprot:OEU06755.1 hypothetical protein FRACYDRAFT_253536 [Fragilariopsis cylindrus CCMP1102]
MADNNNNDEPFGITSIPTTTTTDTSGGGAGAPVSITFNEEIIDTTIFNNTTGTGSIAQQPQTEAFAVYEGIKNSCDEYLIRINSQQIDLNSHFLIYTVKNGLLRVFHRHSAMRALLRGHAGQIVSDIKFFHDGDVVGTIGNSKDGSKSTLIVWRVYEKAPEIGSERLLEISSLEDYGSTPDLSMSSLFWHPFNPNQFFFTHTTQSNKQVATLVETTRIQTRLVDNIDPKDPSSAQHAVCVWNTPYCVMDGAIQLKVDADDNSESSSSSGELVDMCWSGRDARHVLSVHKNGTIVLWDLKRKDKQSSSSGLGLDSSDDDDDDDEDNLMGNNDDNVVLPKKLFVLKNKNTPYSRCFFLPHEQSVTLSASGANNNTNSSSLTTCFVTASHTNSVVTVWSAFLQKGVVGNGNAPPPTLIAPTKLQEINLSGMGSPSSFVLNVCFGPAGIGAGPPSSFLLLGSREVGRLYALHIRSEWSETKSLNNGEAAPTVPLCVGIDYMVPSNITNSMCLPPSGGGVKNSGNGGVFTVEPLSGPYVENANDPKYDEDEYDIDDIDENEGGSAIAPTAAAKITAAPTPAAAKITSAPAPAPSSGGLFPGAANPFANWLGGIASAVSSSTSKATTEDDDLPEPPPPPQPSAMGMGMDNNGDVVPPPPPPSPGMAAAIMGTPPGMPSKTTTPPTSSPVAADPEPPSGLTVQEFLNPLELLKNSQSAIELQDKATAASAAAASDDDKPTSNNKQKKSKKAGRSKSPKNTTSKSRSKSPKGKRNNTSNTNQNKSPFPDTKVTILKRSPDSADSLSQLAGSATTAAPAPPPLPPIVAAVQQIDSEQLEEEVTKAVEKAISKLVPSINKTVQESFASLARPLRNSMDSLSKNGITVDSKQLKEVMDVETPLKAELANTVRTVLVPTLEAIAGTNFNELKSTKIYFVRGVPCELEALLVWALGWVILFYEYCVDVPVKIGMGSFSNQQ